jgi:hypothetical protein
MQIVTAEYLVKEALSIETMTVFRPSQIRTALGTMRLRAHTRPLSGRGTPVAMVWDAMTNSENELN